MKHTGIHIKILSVVTVALLGLACVSLLSFYNAQHMVSLGKQASEVSLATIRIVEELGCSLSSTSLLSVTAATRSDLGQIAKDKEYYQSALTSTKRALDKLSTTTTDSTTLNLVRELHTQLPTYEKACNDVFQKCLNFMQSDAVVIIDTELIPRYEKLNLSVKQIKVISLELAEKEPKTIVESAESFRIHLILVVSLTFILTLGIGYITVKGIIRGLSAVINTIRESSDFVASASNEMATSSESIAIGASEQAASVDQTVLNMEELARTTHDAAKIAVDCVTISDEAVHLSLKCSESVNSMCKATELIQNSVVEVANECARQRDMTSEARNSMNQTRSLMQELNSNAIDIGSLVQVVSRIASQTNLLALNATIEAASAGEAGKGFAVVANEVKQLARESAEAAASITKQVLSIQNNTTAVQQAVLSTEKMIFTLGEIALTISSAVQADTQNGRSGTNAISNQVNSLLDYAESSIKQIGLMRESNERLKSSLNTIAVAAKEQGESATAMNHRFEAINTTVQSNAAAAEELAALSASLKQGAVDAQNAVCDLEQLAKGGNKKH